MSIRIKDYMALISKYRTPIMGLAIINVLFGHSGMTLWGPFEYLVNSVWLIDIFFFFSGLGAYHSLSKNDNVLDFYIRRVKRIYPAYLPAVLAYMLVIARIVISDGGVSMLIKETLGNALMLGWISGMKHQFNWYPQAIMLVYLMTPAIFFLIRRFDGDKKKLLLLLGYFVLGQVCFLGTTYLIAVSRIINFLLGMLAADAAKRDADIKLNIPLLLLSAVVGHLLICLGLSAGPDAVWALGTSWYPAIIAIPGTMYVFCKFFEFVESKKHLGWFMWIHNITGRYSFEIFMAHIVIYELISIVGINNDSKLFLTIKAVGTCAVSIFYGKLTDRIRKKLG